MHWFKGGLVLMKEVCLFPHNSISYHPNSTYITSTDGVHGEQVISVAQLELDHLFSCSEVSELLLLRVTALLNQILQEKSVFTHPLDRLQQVGRQVHLIAQLHLFILKTTR